MDFLLLQRLALPVNIGAVQYPGIKIHDARMIRLKEVLLHGGNTVVGWTALTEVGGLYHAKARRTRVNPSVF